MGDFFKRNRLRFLLCILALLIGVLLYAAMQSGQTTGVMGVVLNPLRQVTQTVSKQAERLVTMCFLTPVPSLDMSQTTPSTVLLSTRVRMMALNCKTLW